MLVYLFSLDRKFMGNLPVIVVFSGMVSIFRLAAILLSGLRYIELVIQNDNFIFDIAPFKKLEFVASFESSKNVPTFYSNN